MAQPLRPSGNLSVAAQTKPEKERDNRMTDESGWEITSEPTMVGKRAYTGTVRAVSAEAKSFVVHVGLDVEGDFDSTPEGFERVVLEFFHDPYLQDAMKDLRYGENTIVELIGDGHGGIDAQPAFLDEA